MILVTGATGNIGSEVVRQLAALGHQVRAFVRNLDKAQKLKGPHVELARGDISDLDTLRPAMQGVEKVFLVSAGPENIELNEPKVVTEAARAGAKHVVKLSVYAAEAEASTIAQAHRSVEKKIEASGMTWTFIRPAAFASNLLNAAGMVKSQGKLFGPYGDGKMAYLHPADIASVAVKALTEPGHENRAYSITGPEAFSQAQVAQKLSAAAGKPVQYVDTPPETARENMLKAGMPPRLVEGLMQLSDAVRAGKTAFTTPELERVLGRPPRTLDEWLNEHAAAFR
ncbi:MAG TPA: SDR family oxidoreductase [Myxococcales bacterium]|nr:SDR family oxidoreductase [Myxococcales bacterium]